MVGSTENRGRILDWILGRSGIVALLCLLLAQPVAFADDIPGDDEPVGWPLRPSDKARMDHQLQGQKPATPLPQRSEVTEQALAAWPAVGGSAAAAEIASPEIAPLKRIIPPLRHERILYAPGDFSISVATAERLDQLAMRLSGTRDRISIVAHSSNGAGDQAGDAQISTHEAVKLSFKRAMLVRLYLIEEGVSPEQIDLEALPLADDAGPPDRVEISPTAKAARR
jgi:outer membrane protein OmpA-like peptidoglycan-associated protein